MQKRTFVWIVGDTVEIYTNIALDWDVSVYASTSALGQHEAHLMQLIRNRWRWSRQELDTSVQQGKVANYCF